MKTLVCRTPHEFEMQDTGRPLPGAGEVLLKIRRVGLCGTDYHAFHGTQPYFEYPRILGHEIVGEVAGLGTGVSGHAVGDRVTVIPYVSCGHCIACRNGKPNACRELKVIGCHVDGAMREYLAVPASAVVPADGLTMDQAIIVEPMSIGLHGVNRAEPVPGEWVLVLGAGPIGLACMKFAKLAGAKVIAVDVNRRRLDFCREWAAVDHAVEAGADTLAQVAAVTGGDLATRVIDCTGSAKAMMGAFDLAAPGGTVVYVSLVLADITFSDPDFHKKELTLRGSRAATLAEFATVVEHLRAGDIDASAFITHRAGFDDAIPSILHWIKPDSGVIKAVLDF